nr:hypothetical protein [Elizabethkingia sp. ASV34]
MPLSSAASDVYKRQGTYFEHVLPAGAAEEEEQESFIAEHVNKFRE